MLRVAEFWENCSSAPIKVLSVTIFSLTEVSVKVKVTVKVRMTVTVTVKVVPVKVEQ